MDDGDWINSSNDKVLAEEGVTCGFAKIERGLKELHRQLIFDRMDFATQPWLARHEVESSYIRRGFNRAGRQVWQVQRNKIGLLRDWVEDEKQWISHNNWDRLSALGFTNGDQTIRDAIARLYQQDVDDLTDRGTAPAKAIEQVQRSSFRRGLSEQDNSVWQIHSRALPRLRDYLDRPAWINTHNRQELAHHGIILPAVEIDRILRKHILNLVRTFVEEGMDAEKATAHIEHTMIQQTLSRYRKKSFDIRRDYLPTLLNECPALGSRRQEEWMSATSPRLWALGVTGSEQVIERAMILLRDKKVAFLVDNLGEEPEEAHRQVAESVVREMPGDGGIMKLKIHEDYVPELAEILHAMPHQKAYAARAESTRRTKASKGGDGPGTRSH
ncbi:MAG: hypothetical protein WDN72_05170 [Alphaproteobacteria bacterium]